MCFAALYAVLCCAVLHPDAVLPVPDAMSPVPEDVVPPATDDVLRYRMLGFEKQYVFGRILDYGKIYNINIKRLTPARPPRHSFVH